MSIKNEKEISTTKSEYKCPPAKIKRSNNINTNSLPSVSDDLLFFNYRASSIHNLIQTFEVYSFNKIFKRELDTFSDNNVHSSLCHQHYCKRIKKDSRFQNICIACYKTILNGRQVSIADIQYNNTLSSLAEFDETSKNSTKTSMCMYY